MSSVDFARDQIGTSSRDRMTRVAAAAARSSIAFLACGAGTRVCAARRTLVWGKSRFGQSTFLVIVVCRSVADQAISAVFRPVSARFSSAPPLLFHGSAPRQNR